MTAPALEAVDVAATWPAVAPRVAAALRARGAKAADVDDVVQEVAVRALGRIERFETDEHFVRWCCRVAINLYIDGVRQARRVGPPVRSDMPGLHDTARDAERRIALDRLASSIAELSAEDRRLLFDSTPADSRREGVRLAVRRHRLRARLAAMVEGLAAAFGGLRRISRKVPTPAKLAVAAVPIVAAELALGPLLVPQSGSPAEVTIAPARAVPVTLGADVMPRTAAAPAARPQGPAAVASVTAAVRTVGSTPPRRVVDVTGPAAHVVVSHYSRPEDNVTVCTHGTIQVCVDHPRPAPLPTPKPLL